MAIAIGSIPVQQKVILLELLLSYFLIYFTLILHFLILLDFLLKDDSTYVIILAIT